MKKRPKHSEFMKQYTLEGKNKTAWKPGQKNHYVNSVEWKRKVLLNKGYDAENFSDDLIISSYSQLMSERKKSKPHKIKRILSGYEKYKDEYNLNEHMDIENIENKSDEVINEYYKNINSITKLNSKNLCGAKRFKRTFLTDFQYNTKNQSSVYTRSSYETNYIKFFEKNKIWWEYETLKIKKTGGGYILPDFIFHYKGKSYILEVKGYLLDENFYFTNYLFDVYKYATKNNYVLLFSYDEKIKDINILIEEKVVTIK